MRLRPGALGGVEIDAGARRVRVGAATRWEQVTPRLSELGLAALHGSSPDVGIVGYSLGGGIGWLARRHGMQTNAVTAIELVTADGDLIRTDHAHEPELFWALRGGGGNFGVVTSLTYALNELPAFTGGMLCLPATPETVAGFVAAAENAPDELSTIANVMPAPPMPFLPPELHGKLVILGMLAFAGPDADAQRALVPFRALAKPYADFVKPGPYTQMYPPEDSGYHPTAVSRNMFMDHIGLTEAGTIVDRLARSDAVLRVAQIRVLGGASARVPADATAYGHRQAAIMVNLAAFWTTPEDQAKQQAWVDRFRADLTQETQGAYVNFLMAEGHERIRSAYPGAIWDRLRTIKRQYDPHNLFRLNQNIAPADA